MLPARDRSTAAPARSPAGASTSAAAPPRPSRSSTPPSPTRQVRPGELTLGTDNGTALTARAFRARLAEHGIVHRRGGYRDPESQAFIESWFSKLKQRCVWREEFETLDQARAAIGAYIDRYHHRPHSGLAYRTPREVAATWKDHDDQLTPAA